MKGKNKKIRIVILEETGAVKVKMVKNNLKKFQSIVKGYIDVSRFDYFDLYFNDDFLYEEGFKQNPNIKSFPILGNAFLIKGIDKNGESIGFSLEQATLIKEQIEKNGL